VKLYRNLTEAVVDGLRQIFIDNKYADKVIEKILKQNPKWGARDRRFIAETTYDVVRWYRLFQHATNAGPGDFWKLVGAWVLWKNEELPAWPEFYGLGERNFTAAMKRIQDVAVRESVPDWMFQTGESELGRRWVFELHSLNEPARVVLRANTLKVSRGKLQHHLEQEEHIATEAPEAFPDALLLEERQNIFTRPAFRDGLFEVQDAGSQLIAPFLKVEPGMRVVDACAGGGGKTLHLAALMQNKGRIISMDTEAWKLEELKKRARRAGAGNIETRVIDSTKVIKRMEKSADRLLLDVPCSGLGVLRRNPDAKWKLSPESLEKVRDTQQEILRTYSNILRPGGVLVYATCSVLPSENEKQVQSFLKTNPNFELEAEHHQWPSEGFDGFYMARLKRKE
jgi:16S rRNA (cytosine967-C5)-methyltransferase